MLHLERQRTHSDGKEGTKDILPTSEGVGALSCRVCEGHTRSRNYEGGGGRVWTLDQKQWSVFYLLQNISEPQCL